MKGQDNPELILSNAVSKDFKKGDILLRTGDYSEVAYYVEKGCLRSFVIDSKGKEHILQFAPEGWLISDLEGMVNKKSSNLYIDAIEDTTVRILKGEERFVPEVLEKPVLIELVQKFQKRIFTLQKRVIQLISATAEERYNDFNLTYPDLANRIPQKMIASYLGITPESLSRVRKDISTHK